MVTASTVRRAWCALAGILVIVAVPAVLACGRAVPAAPPDAARADAAGLPPGYEPLAEARVPRTLDEAVDTLLRSLPHATLETLRAAESDATIALQDTVGRWMRDHWGLWAGSPLADHLRALGLDHADDMSGVILTSFWRRLHFQPLRVEAQVRWYRAYRRAISPPAADSNPACPTRVDITAWWTPRLEAPALAGEARERLRIVHLGTCCADGRLWSWEAGRGWYDPEPAHRTHWERLPGGRRTCQ